MVASHNEDTVRFTLQQMQKNNIKPEDKVRIWPSKTFEHQHLLHQVICFGQLLGMCDNLSFPLGKSHLTQATIFKLLKHLPQVKQASAFTSTSHMDR